MYLHDAFNVSDAAEARAMLSAGRLGCLVTHGADWLFATHMPFVFDAGRQTLSGHVPRDNPHWQRAGDGQAMVIYQGLDAYISPSWYPSKAEHGRVVPTWNYEAVHVYGHLTFHPEPEWLASHLARLVDRFEAGREQPWAMADAPENYLARMMAALVGVELSIDRIEAKRKLSQNRAEADRQGVIAGLSSSADPADRAMAQVMAQTGDGG